jgi:hypothetical protein
MPSTPALAAAATPVPAGACTGVSDGSVDCVTATGHISASVVGTLSINEVRAVSFGDFAFSGQSDGTGTVLLDPTDNTRTVTANSDTIIGMHGNSANDGLGGAPGDDNSGGQSYGIYHISGASENATDTVYISFYTNDGKPINICDPDGTNCDTTYDDTNEVDVSDGTSHFYAGKFSFVNAATPGTDGTDVYGHYTQVDTGEADIRVGATLHTDTAGSITYGPGKYTGTFNINVSY